MSSAFLRSIALVACTAAPALAGAELTREDGLLGSSVHYRLLGDPGELFVLMPSFTGGPTPIALLDPADPRVLGVGLDLIAFWQVLVPNGAGFAQIAIPLPAKPALSGLPLFAQFVTLFGAGTLVDEISNRTAFVLAAHGDVVAALGLLPDETATTSLTTLADGRVLVAGGLTPAGSGNLDALSTVLLFDPETQTFASSTASLQNGRYLQASVLLADGRVLFVGGVDQSAVSIAAEIYDPLADALVPAPSLSVPRVLHSATRLLDGRVLVCGGTGDFNGGDVIGSLADLLKSTELYDPSTNQWSAGPSLPKGLFMHAATLLPSGQVLITGGIEVDVLFGIPLAAVSSRALRYDPAANAFLSAASLGTARALHAQTALPGGDVLAAGGLVGSILQLSLAPGTSCERYAPLANAWKQVASLGFARALFSLVDTGTAVVAIGGLGAFDLANPSAKPVRPIEVADPLIAGWVHVADTLAPRPLGGAVAFDGARRILITGGDESTLPVKDLTAEIFHP